VIVVRASALTVPAMMTRLALLLVLLLHVVALAVQVARPHETLMANVLAVDTAMVVAWLQRPRD
jgi:hypothetical protein